MIDFGKIKFIQEYDDHRIEHEIRGDASLDDVVDAFEAFLKGAGFHLKEGQHIGYEYDEESEYQKRKEMYDSMDDMAGVANVDTISIDAEGVTHSKYYWDTERNK